MSGAVSPLPMRLQRRARIVCINIARSEVNTVVTIRIILLLDVTQCSLVEIYKYFPECSPETFADLYYGTRFRCVEDVFQNTVSVCVPLQSCTPHYSNVIEVAACCRRTSAEVESM